ncbi:hypothetical protein HFO06_36415 [Rhizobium leguminosarum]|uniref:hypothetical protein n=1 Tax=Rhizobium leguminosarum TaxID=384 RepID=UPI001C95E988|nr:hypothetical protein [Rhizobium leguminosarum]MBY5768467.1 hypothetical protein [Rhizobium leguminosarum]
MPIEDVGEILTPDHRSSDFSVVAGGSARDLEFSYHCDAIAAIYPTSVRDRWPLALIRFYEP